jgi:hypothetical protein
MKTYKVTMTKIEKQTLKDAIDYIKYCTNQIDNASDEKLDTLVRDVKINCGKLNNILLSK